jgi:branched-chain amino acid transport system substrate-binding protein
MRGWVRGRDGRGRRRRSLTLAAGVLAAGSMLAACSNADPGPARGAPYRLGATVDLSGPLAAYGKGFVAAWQGYLDEVNARGGVAGHRVELTVLDDGSEPARQTANMRELLADKVLLVSGITVSDTCALLSSSLSKARVPELCTTIPATLAVAPPPFVFGMSNPETMWVRAMTQVIQQEVQSADIRVATILPDVAGLQDMGDAFAAAAAAQSWTVAATETVPLASLADVHAQVAAVLAAKPDAVVTDIASVGAIPMVQQLRAGGFTGPVVMGNADYAVLAGLKDPSVFQIWPTDVVDPASSSTAVQSMVRALASQGVTGVEALNSVAIPIEYLGAAMVVKALQGCADACTPTALDASLGTTSLSLTGLTVGHYGYDAHRNVPNTSVDVYHWDTAAGVPREYLSEVPAVQPFPIGP